MSHPDLEQEARIALMDHFRSFAQYWGTILLTLAVASLSLVQIRVYVPIEVFRFGLVVIVMEGFYALTRMFSHQKLCLLAITTKLKPTKVSDMHIACISLLYEAVIKELRFHRLGRVLDGLGRRLPHWALLSVVVGLLFTFILHLP